MKWLQLSDLHCYFENYETDVLRENMLRYLQENFKNSIDCLFITGDLSHQGKDFSVEISSHLDEIMEVLEITKDSIFMIPGNHDVQRSPMSERVIKQMITSEKPLDEINSIDDGTRKLCESTLENYYEFYRNFFELDINDRKNHFVIKYDKYNIIHINTAIYSGINNVEGKLLINLSDILSTFRTLDKNKINIALGHHPVECFHPDICNSFINRLSDYNVSLYLSGHVHNSKYFKEANNNNDMYFFTSGSIIDEDYGDITFLSGSIDEDSGNSVVSFHTWNSTGEYWMKKNDLGRMAPRGDYSFNLDKKEPDEVEEYSNQAINTNEFQQFLIDFYEVISKNEIDSNFELKDVSKKFRDMRCVFTERKYDLHAQAFSVVNHVVNSSAYGSLERRMLIPSEIMKVYETVYAKNKSGDIIYNEIVSHLCDKYVNSVNYDNIRLELYISILISWSIYGCDIFNEVQSE